MVSTSQSTSDCPVVYPGVRVGEVSSLVALWTLAVSGKHRPKQANTLQTAYIQFRATRVKIVVLGAKSGVVSYKRL